MMRKLIHILVFICCFITITQAQLKILPLGNSITYGNYRYDLWQMLIDEGIDFEFVGSVNSTPVSGGQMNAWPPYQGHVFDDSHEGHSGWKSYDILYESPWNPGAGNIYTWLGTYTPDMVLLHIGTNDVTHLPANESADYIIQIIRALQADNPNVVVFLAKIIPREGYYNEVTALNNYMENVAEHTSTATSCIKVVDHFSNFDLWADTYDGIHPDRSGDVKMAQRWTNGIVDYLNESSGSCGPVVIDCTDMQLNLSISQEINCFSGQNGEMIAQAIGGSAPYQYRWSNGGQAEIISGLETGNYSLTVTDANQCERQMTQFLPEPNQLNITLSASPTSLVNGDNGSAQVDVLGGTMPYSYAWNNGAISPQINDLVAGIYSVTVTDIKGCMRIDTTVVTSPECVGFEVQLSAIEETCFGEQDGQIIAEIVGEHAPYDLAWSNGLQDEHLWGLSTGTYELTVTDNIGCVETSSITMGTPSALVTETTSTNTTCGLENGIATVSVSGGFQPYTVIWENGATEMSISDLAAGIYEVSITDHNGCATIDSQTIAASEEMQLMIERTNISCFGYEDGKIETMVTKGTAPFRYEWSNGSDMEDLENLAAGSYSVEVQDVLDCSVSALISIASPDSLAAVIHMTAAVDGDYGTASVEVSGGIPEYQYIWSHGEEGQTVTDLAAGLYEVSITDAHFCELVETVQIEQITAVEPVINTAVWAVYPNPMDDFCWIEIEFSKIQNFQLNIYNAVGERLQFFDYEVGKLKKKLLIQDYAAGVYFLELKTDTGRLVEKLVIVK